MKILKLTAENIKALKAVEIEPSGNVVVITGENGAGKSSVLDSIEYALYGGKSLPERPIRNGQQSARIELDLGTIVVERTFTKKGSYLTIRAEDDSKITSPQKLLDDICGEIAFDPLAFVNEPDAKKQRKILLDLIGVDLDANTQAIAGIKEQRRIINRDITAHKGALASFADPPPDLEIPDEELSVTNLAEDLVAAQRNNQELDAQERRMATCQKLIQQAQGDYEQSKAFCDTHSRIDEEVFKIRIADSEQINRLVRENKARANVQSRLKTAQAMYKKQGGDVELLEQGKAELLQNAKMPVEGLSVDEDGVMFDGIPIAQIASSEKLKVGVGSAWR